MPPRLGILAGGGNIPRQLLDAGRQQGRDVFVAAFQGSADPETVADAPHCWVRLGAVGQLIRALKDAGVEELVMAGPIDRPSWTNVRPDWRGLKMLPRVLAAAQGDDSILSLAIAELESEGFRVIGIDDLLPEMLAPAGPFGRHEPDDTASADIARGLAVATALGDVDVGQSVVVQQGIVLGVEAVEGTDALLERCGPLSRAGPGGVLIKRAKPSQDRRADLPTIGPRTVAGAKAAGLRGIAVAAGSTLLVDREKIIATADQNGLFVIGIQDDT